MTDAAAGLGAAPAVAVCEAGFDAGTQATLEIRIAAPSAAEKTILLIVGPPRPETRPRYRLVA
jgi:hypothetical protein